MYPKTGSGKVPLISEPPSSAHHTRSGAGNNVVVTSGPRTERGRELYCMPSNLVDTLCI